MENFEARKPAAAGQFYSADSNRLRGEIELLIDKKAVARDVVACMMPHAGYMYSGQVAGKTISNVSVKERVIILGPNHTGHGSPLGIMASGTWQMPFKDVEIDSEFAHKLLDISDYLEEDVLSHVYEHSLEVQLPFLQYFKEDFKIVPITVSTEELEVYKQVGREIAETIKYLKAENSTLIIASSDMTHSEPQDQAEKKDRLALEAILALDEDRLMETVDRHSISMCGYAPVIITIAASKALGATTSELVKYQTSGDITKDFNSVVGYAGVVIY